MARQESGPPTYLQLGDGGDTQVHAVLVTAGGLHGGRVSAGKRKPVADQVELVETGIVQGHAIDSRQRPVLPAIPPVHEKRLIGHPLMGQIPGARREVLTPGPHVDATGVVPEMVGERIPVMEGELLEGELSHFKIADTDPNQGHDPGFGEIRCPFVPVFGVSAGIAVVPWYLDAAKFPGQASRFSLIAGLGGDQSPQQNRFQAFPSEILCRLQMDPGSMESPLVPVQPCLVQGQPASNLGQGVIRKHRQSLFRPRESPLRPFYIAHAGREVPKKMPGQRIGRIQLHGGVEALHAQRENVLRTLSAPA